jgi:hypothetical protein
MGFSRLLVKYRRVGYMRMSNNDADADGDDSGVSDADDDITSHEVEAKFSINLLNYELRAGLIEEKDISMARFNRQERVTKSEIADMFRIKFIESKKKLLLMQAKTLIPFMENSAGHHDNLETFCDFFEKSIEGIAPNLFSSDGELHGFWLDPFFYILVRIWNNILTENDDFREIITKQLQWSNYDTLEEASSIHKVFNI